MPLPDSPATSHEAVRMDSVTYLELDAPYSAYNDTVTIPNQALFGIWEGAAHQERHSLATTALFNILRGLETSLVDQATVAEAIATQPVFSDAATFANNVGPATGFDAGLVAHLWHDQYYGFTSE